MAVNEITKTVQEFNAPLPVVKVTSILDVIDRASTDPSVDVTKMEKLLSMYERVQAREAEMQFNAAMTGAQKEMRSIAADASNPQTHSKYASYNALDKVLRPIYTQQGFALSFDTGDAAENYVRVLCYVSHGAGHTRTYRVDMPADGKGAKGGDVMTKTHAAGAAMSYGSRYLLKLIFNVAVGEHDDDGNGASASEYISADQVATLKSMIARGWPEDAEYIGKFCGYLTKLTGTEIEALRDLPGKYYEQAVVALNLAERKKAPPK